MQIFQKISLRKEVKASLAYTVCNIIQRSINFFTLPVFTRLMTTDEFGKVTLYTSWRALLELFITLNLAYGSFDTALVKFQGHRKEYISSVNILCTFLCVIFLSIYFLFRPFFDGLFRLPSIFVVFMVIDSLFGNAILMWIAEKKYDFNYQITVKVSLLQTFLSTSLAVILVVFGTNKVFDKIFGNTIIVILFGGALFLYSLFQARPIVKMEYIKYALSFNIPLIGYYLSQVVFNQSDRIMISWLTNDSNTAIYGVGYQLAFVLHTIINSVNGAYVPWIYRKILNKEEIENEHVATGIALIISILLLGLIFVAPEVLFVFAGKKYLTAIWVVPPVAISVLLLLYTHFFLNVEFYYEKKKLLVAYTVGAAIINIVLNYIFIPYYGFIAAGYTTLFSYFIFAIGNYYAYRKIAEEKKLDPNMFNIRYLLLILAFLCVVSFAAILLYKTIVLRYIVLLILLTPVFTKRNDLLKLMYKLRGN